MSKSRFDYAGLHFGFAPYNLKDKPGNITYYVGYILDRLQTMFKWNGLPETIPQRHLEFMLQCNGSCIITDCQPNNYERGLYSFVGGWGGQPDIYYFPTQFIVANPYYHKSHTIGEDCVLLGNDSLYTGLMPMLTRYATQLTENDITLNMADINIRLMSLITAPDDATKLSAEAYIKKLIDGDMAVIGENGFLDGIKVQPYSASGSGNQLTQILELKQYLFSQCMNELGLNAQWNAKREAINSAESGLNEDVILPLVDDMLKMRQRGAELVNEMYGTNITVEFAGAWSDENNEPETDEPESKEVEENGTDKESI